MSDRKAIHPYHNPAGGSGGDRVGLVTQTDGIRVVNSCRDGGCAAYDPETDPLVPPSSLERSRVNLGKAWT
jgi:hypothetical protein